MIIGVNQYGLIKVPIKKVCNIYYLRWYYNGWHYWAFIPGKYTVVTEGEKYRTIGTRKIAMGSGQLTRSQCNAIRIIMNTREVYLLTIAGWMNIRIEPGTINVYNNQVAGEEIEFVAIIGSKELTYTTGFSPVGVIPIITPPSFSSYCEVIIGNQIWMCKNWDSNYPGSKVYNNDEANRTIYGGLYSYSQIMNPGFCPVGWHIPTKAEWETLITFLVSNEGKKLKDDGHGYWFAPDDGSDDYDFTALGAGYYGSVAYHLGFYSLYSKTKLLTSTPDGTRYCYIAELNYNSDLVSLNSILTNEYCSVRLIKDIPPVFLNINNLITNWDVIFNWTLFTNIGNDITAAIRNNASIAYSSTNTIAVTAGDLLEIEIDVVINSGDNPCFYIWDIDSLSIIAAVYTGTQYYLQNGNNKIKFQIPVGCSHILCNITNLKMDFVTKMNVDFQTIMT